MDCIEAACEARILWKVISKSQLRVTSVTFIVHHCTLCPYDTFQAIYEMLETQFPRQDYQESRILFKDENGIFSEDSATKCAKQVLLASGTDLQGRNTRVRCHLWGVVRSGVKKTQFFPVLLWMRWVQQLDLWALGVSSCVLFHLVLQCSAVAFFSFSFSFFLFSDWWQGKESRVNLDDLDWNLWSRLRRRH